MRGAGDTRRCPDSARPGGSAPPCFCSRVCRGRRGSLRRSTHRPASHRTRLPCSGRRLAAPSPLLLFPPAPARCVGSSQRAAFGLPSAHTPLGGFGQFQPVLQPEPQAAISIRRDPLHQVGEDLAIEGGEELWQGFQRFQQLPRPGDGVVVPIGQKPLLFLLCGPELAGQFIALGYKNIRVDQAALVHVGQHSILIVDIGYSLVPGRPGRCPGR